MFKKGDQVVCIDADGWARTLTAGKVYKVRDADDPDVITIYHDHFPGLNRFGEYNSYRFELLLKQSFQSTESFNVEAYDNFRRGM